MKRAVGENSGPPNKTPKKEGGIVLRLLIPSRAAGIVIGKKGENIKKIRQDHNARMNIPDAQGPERVFVIESDMQSCINVVGDLLPKLKDIIDGRLSDPKVIMGKRPQAKKDEKDSEDIVDVRMLVHQSQAGCVIGRGGERIRELRQNHNMKVIKVYQVPAPQSTDRVVQMVASAENVLQCMQVVLDSLENAPPRGPRHDYQADFSNERMALDYGGWISPGGPRGPPVGPPMMGGMGFEGYGAYPPGPPDMYGTYPPMSGPQSAPGYPPKGGQMPSRGPPRGAERPPRGPPRGNAPPAGGDKGGYDYYPPAQGTAGWKEPGENWM